MNTSSKVCTCCNTKKLNSQFHNHAKSKDGLNPQCRSCINKKLRNYRNRISYKVTFKYEKTLKGKLVRTYRNMLSRVNGIQKKKEHLYLGLSILDKEEFYTWSLSNEDYLQVFKNWVDSDYNRKLSPSIDRIDAEFGYIEGNIRWITHIENSSQTRQNKIKYLKEDFSTKAYKEKQLSA